MQNIKSLLRKKNKILSGHEFVTEEQTDLSLYGDGDLIMIFPSKFHKFFPDCVLPNIQNAIVDGDVSIGGTFRVVCADKYGLCGVRNLTCTENSTWDSSIPHCK